jgi:hypothetical protein
MAVYKRKYDSGTVLWYFKFQPPGAARGSLPIRQFGFATKREAEDAEANRRIEEQQKFDLAKAGSGVASAPPKTLSMLLDEFFRQHVEKKLAPKTMERYHEQAKYLDPELLAMPLAGITPLHLNREWNRLLQNGGHTRRHKTKRPLSAKSVRSIAGVVSSAFHRAVKWGSSLLTRYRTANRRSRESTGEWRCCQPSRCCWSNPRVAPGASRCSWNFRLQQVHDEVKS